MSTRAATTSRTPRPSARSRAAKRRAGRRRLFLVVLVVIGAAGGMIAASPLFHKAVKELSLPLRHEDVIRQQAADKHLDPALIAAVIYTESHFRDETSAAGAEGLMQLLPSTADYIASLSGGTKFVHGDLSTPQINIAYGSYYLAYLLRKYNGSEVLALAAYNAGETKVNEWVASTDNFTVAGIPFPETRAYVSKVLTARKQYAREYKRELGL